MVRSLPLRAIEAPVMCFCSAEHCVHCFLRWSSNAQPSNSPVLATNSPFIVDIRTYTTIPVESYHQQTRSTVRPSSTSPPPRGGQPRTSCTSRPAPCSPRPCRCPPRGLATRHPPARQPPVNSPPPSGARRTCSCPPFAETRSMHHAETRAQPDGHVPPEPLPAAPFGPSVAGFPSVARDWKRAWSDARTWSAPHAHS